VQVIQGQNKLVAAVVNLIRVRARVCDLCVRPVLLLVKKVLVALGAHNVGEGLFA